MDAIVQVAFFGFIGTVVTASGLVLTTIINNRRERTKSADASLEATLRERILLRDEQIIELEKDKMELLEKVRKYESSGRSPDGS